MMKKIGILCVLVAFLGLLVVPAEAVGIQFGLKGGLSRANISHENLGFPPEVKIETKSGIVGGVFLKVSLAFGLAIQPEVLYAQKGAVARGRIGADLYEMYMDMNNLEIPVLLKYSLLAGMPVSPNVYVGPYFGFRQKSYMRTLVNGVQVSKEEVTADEVKKDNYGLAIGAGVDFNLGIIKLLVDVRYTIGMGNVMANPNPGQSVKDKTMLLMAGIAF